MSASEGNVRRFELEPPTGQALWAATGVWLSVGLSMALVWLAAGWFRTPVNCLTFVGLAGATPFMAWLMLPVFRLAQGKRLWLGWTLVALGVLLISAVQYGWEFAFVAFLRQFFPDEVRPTPSSLPAVINNSLDFLTTNGMVAALLALTGAAARTRQEAAKALRAQAEAAEAELRALRLQLNPHLLLNSLNGVSALIAAGRGRDAQATLDRLSAFLSSALKLEPTGKVTLNAELDAIGEFLDVEAVRFGDRLSIEFDCPASLGDVLVPELILQPLVENAIKYAVAPAQGPVRLTIAARTEGARLRLTVADSGGAQDPGAGGHGVGQRNTFQRLQALYGEAGVLQAGRRGDGYAVEIRIPIERAAHMERAGEAPALT